MKTQLILSIVIILAAVCLAEPLANENLDGLYVRSIEQVMRTEPEQIDIGTAALIVAEEWSELVHGRRYQQQLDDMAIEIRDLIEEKKLTGNYKAVYVINDYLYNELGFRTVKDADDPNDLFLHSVLDNKRGYCLSLSILYLAIGERLGLPLYGVVVPEHFFVRYDDGKIKFNIETTSGGGYLPDEHYYKEYPFPDNGGETLYMQNLNKLQTLGCLFNNFGTAYLAVDNIDAAQRALEKAVDINPSLAEAHSNLGNIYLQKERIDDAIYEYRSSIEINPSNSTAWHNLGNAYSKKDWHNDAMNAYEQALKLDPNNADTYLGLASVYTKIEMLSKAEYLLNQAKILEPGRSRIYLMLGDISYQKGQYKQAIKQYQTAVDVDGKNALPYFQMALCYEKLGMVKNEIQSFKNALKIDPEMFAAYINLGNIYHKQKDYNKALDYYKQAEQLQPDNVHACFALGSAYLSLEKYAQAVVYYHKAVTLDPQMPHAHYNLGISYYNLKNYEKAYEHILKAQQLGLDVNPEQIKDLEKKLNY